MLSDLSPLCVLERTSAEAVLAAPNYGDSALNRPFGAACRAVSFIHASNLHRRALPEMRVKPNFSSRITLICPVQPYSKKYSDFQKSQITL